MIILQLKLDFLDRMKWKEDTLPPKSIKDRCQEYNQWKKHTLLEIFLLNIPVKLCDFLQNIRRPRHKPLRMVTNYPVITQSKETFVKDRHIMKDTRLQNCSVSNFYFCDCESTVSIPWHISNVIFD